jgi:hypothetical protein
MASAAVMSCSKGLTVLTPLSSFTRWRRWRGRRGGGAGQAITLEQVFDLVEAGCRGDTQAGQLAYGLVTQVLQASSNPPQIRALGKTLQRILEGLRGEEALAGLPAELRPPVEALLRRLTHSSP